MIVGLVSGQVTVKITKNLSLPASFAKAEFSPTDFAIGAGSIYYLDQKTRRLAVEGPDGIVTYAGGMGREKDAMFDPVDMFFFDLGLYICDQSENRILRFDWRLNYVNHYITESSKIGHLYPSLIRVDPWGKLFIYSDNLHEIYEWDGRKFSLFLDLNREPLSQSCLSAFNINAEGDFALVYPCLDELHIYNRFGRLMERKKISLAEPEYLLTTDMGWIILSGAGSGQIFSALGNPVFSIKGLGGTILDALPNGDGLMILSSKQVVSLVLKMDH